MALGWKIIDFLVVEQIQNYFQIHDFTGLGRLLRATQLPGFAWVTTTITAGAPTSILKQLLTTTGKKFNDWRFLINFLIALEIRNTGLKLVL